MTSHPAHLEPRGSHSTDPFDEERIAIGGSDSSGYIIMSSSEPVYKSYLLIAGEWRYGLERPMPNRWWRF